MTAFMKDHPRVDALRLGVMGGSYGGYMTTWAIGHTHDFAAAITDRSVSNVVSLGATSDFVEEPDRYFPGNFWDRPETRWEQSPIKYLGNASTPTLIIHSEGDLRCNIEQAEQLFAALKLLDVETRFVRYPTNELAPNGAVSRNGPSASRAAAISAAASTPSWTTHPSGVIPGKRPRRRAARRGRRRWRRGRCGRRLKPPLLRTLSGRRRT